MILNLSTTHRPATDLGYLLHKHPDRLQTFDLAFGQAHVIYPEAGEARCTAALILDVDPITLARGRAGERAAPATLEPYVNDRPYVASSFLSVALAEVFGSALNGRSRDRAELVTRPIPLEARLCAVPCRGGEALLRRLFEPLGYEVEAAGHALDERFPEWGAGRYFTLTLRAETTLQALLTHLYVLIPVLDNAKHYWVGKDEVAKLLHRGEGWLAAHPERDLITERYLRYQRRLTREVLERLSEGDDPDDAAADHAAEEQAAERPIRLHEQRIAAVVVALKDLGARRVLDLGCGEGRLLRALAEEPQFEAIVGVDVAYGALEAARRRVERLPGHQSRRITLLHGALTYRDDRLRGYDAAAIVEVIEHLDPPRLAAFERVVFELARPKGVVVTTPNAEYNRLWPSLPAGKFRHRDHRFEWTRAEFEGWARGVAERFGYGVRFESVGEVDEGAGAPTQMAIFAGPESRMNMDGTDGTQR